MTSTTHILTLSGSLRARSGHTFALEAAAHVAPPDIAVSRFDRLAQLPQFNPDLAPPPPEVIAFAAAVNAADALVIACPEYARGIPGALKNALDWLVGDLHFAGTPVTILNGSPRAAHAVAALELVLRTMSADVVTPHITLPLLGKRMDARAIAADPAMAAALRDALARLATAAAGGSG